VKILNKIFKIIIFVIAITFVLIGGSNQKADYFINKNNLECIYYNPVDFVNIKQFELYKDRVGIRGSIIPHHLLASDLIHEVFQNVCINDYETIVLMGPDHESILMGKVFTTLNDWQTPMGVLKTDYDITNKLLQNNFIISDDEKLTIEHSVSSIVPFVKYYLNDVKIVTLVMSKQTKLADIEKIVEDLSGLINKDKTLFISSVDFSHYLNLEKASQMDSITMEAIKNKDINNIMSFTNDNLDSPVSIVTMLKMMDKLNTTNLYMLNHSNSELILQQKMVETTSYITYLFYDS